MNMRFPEQLLVLIYYVLRSCNVAVDRYMFLCDDWLALNKSDGQIRRHLKPSNAFTAANNSSSSNNNNNNNCCYYYYYYYIHVCR